MTELQYVSVRFPRIAHLLVLENDLGMYLADCRVIQPHTAVLASSKGDFFIINRKSGHDFIIVLVAHELESAIFSNHCCRVHDGLVMYAVVAGKLGRAMPRDSETCSIKVEIPKTVTQLLSRAFLTTRYT